MIFLLYYIELYCCLLFIYIIVKLLRKRKLHYLTLALNLLVIALFYYLRKKVFHHEWMFFGGYESNPRDYGDGIANLWISIENLLVVFFSFLITQIFFWKIFIKNNNRLTNEENTRELLKTLGTQ